jgi:hypothetical protein
VSGVPRSQRLVSFVSTAAATISGIWTCPANTVTLVKSCWVWNNAPAAGDIILIVSSTNGVQLRHIFSQLAAGATADWNGWIALNPGDVCYGYLSAPEQHIWISGAVLLGAPPFPPAERSDTKPGPIPDPSPKA